MLSKHTSFRTEQSVLLPFPPPNEHHDEIRWSLPHLSLQLGDKTWGWFHIGAVVVWKEILSLRSELFKSAQVLPSEVGKQSGNGIIWTEALKNWVSSSVNHRLIVVIEFAQRDEPRSYAVWDILLLVGSPKPDWSKAKGQTNGSEDLDAVRPWEMQAYLAWRVTGAPPWSQARSWGLQVSAWWSVLCSWVPAETGYMGVWVWEFRQADRGGETLNLPVPTLTYGLQLWVMTERMRLWIQVALLSFLCRVAGLSLR